MKILKTGNKLENYYSHLANKTWKKKCQKCGCKFEFYISDTYMSTSVLGVTNHYIKCPQCGDTYYVVGY